MLFDFGLMVQRLRGIGVVACGLVMAGTPMLLWVAWSDTVFFLALIGCLGAVVLLGICLGPDRVPGSSSERVF